MYNMSTVTKRPYPLPQVFILGGEEALGRRQKEQRGSKRSKEDILTEKTNAVFYLSLSFALVPSPKL